MLAIRLRHWKVQVRTGKRQDGNLSALLGLIGGIYLCVLFIIVCFIFIFLRYHHIP